MQKKLHILQAAIYLSTASMVWAEIDKIFIVYTPEEMQEHKKKCIEKIISNPINHRDTTYQMKRALLTISANDADYIPKVVGAGEIFGETLAYQLMHNGIKIILNCYYNVQWMTDVIQALRGHHEPQEEKCFHEVIQYMPDNATMLELGSYWAYYSLWFASRVSNPKNYLIEPDPYRLEVGKKNFKLNDKTGIFKRGFFGKMSDADVDMTGAQAISIDDFMEQQGIKHINILHADIQYAEYEMLQTTKKHIDDIDYFFISTHSNEIHRQCLNFFKAHHITIIAEHSVSESCSADGLIVAKRKGAVGPEHIEIGKCKP